MGLTKGSFMTVVRSKARKLIHDRMWRSLNARFHMLESSPVGDEESLRMRKEGRDRIRLPLT